MNLTRPLVILDLETTSTDTEAARIVQIGLVRFEPGSKNPKTFSSLVDPGIPIPPSATAVHGITDLDVQDALRFRGEFAETVAAWLKDADLGGYNIDAYDLPVLQKEFVRAGYRGVPGPADRVVIDSLTIERVYRPRTLENVYEELTGVLMDGAHDALADAVATAEILRCQLVRYGLEGSMSDVVRALHHPYLDPGHKFMVDEEGYVCLCIGKKHCAGGPKRLSDIARTDPGYIEWMEANWEAPAPTILREWRAKKWREGGETVDPGAVITSQVQGGLF